MNREIGWFWRGPALLLQVQVQFFHLFLFHTKSAFHLECFSLHKSILKQCLGKAFVHGGSDHDTQSQCISAINVIRSQTFSLIYQQFCLQQFDAIKFDALIEDYLG